MNEGRPAKRPEGHGPVPGTNVLGAGHFRALALFDQPVPRSAVSHTAANLRYLRARSLALFERIVSRCEQNGFELTLWRHDISNLALNPGEKPSGSADDYLPFYERRLDLYAFAARLHDVPVDGLTREECEDTLIVLTRQSLFLCEDCPLPQTYTAGFPLSHTRTLVQAIMVALMAIDGQDELSWMYFTVAENLDDLLFLAAHLPRVEAVLDELIERQSIDRAVVARLLDSAAALRSGQL